MQGVARLLGQGEDGGADQGLLVGIRGKEVVMVVFRAPLASLTGRGSIPRTTS